MPYRQEEIIQKLKEIRFEKGISYQSIVDQCEANGEAVSLSAVKRVFGQSGDTGSFRYETTIAPIARVLLNLDATLSPNSILSPAEGEAVREIIDRKNLLMEEYQARLDEKAAEIARLHDEIETIRQSYSAGIRERDRTRRFLCVIIAVLLALIALILVDYFVFPDQFFFRQSLASVIQQGNSRLTTNLQALL